MALGSKRGGNTDQAYTWRVLFLTGLILAPIFWFVVVPLGFKSFEGEATAFAIAVAAFLISAYAYYAWLWSDAGVTPTCCHVRW